MNRRNIRRQLFPTTDEQALAERLVDLRGKSAKPLSFEMIKTINASRDATKTGSTGEIKTQQEVIDGMQEFLTYCCSPRINEVSDNDCVNIISALYQAVSQQYVVRPTNSEILKDALNLYNYPKGLEQLYRCVPALRPLPSVSTTSAMRLSSRASSISSISSTIISSSPSYSSPSTSSS